MSKRLVTIVAMKTRALKLYGLFSGFVVFGCVAYLLIIRPDTDSSSQTSGREMPEASPEVSAAVEGAGDRANAEAAGVTASSPNIMEDNQPAQLAGVAQPNELNDGNETVAADPITSTEEDRSQSQADSGEQEETVQQPVAFAEDSPNPRSSAEQIAEINALRQQFVEEVGGYDQDPSDPEYRRRWREGQQLLDEQLRTQLGEEAFDQLQNESVTGPTSPSPDEEQ